MAQPVIVEAVRTPIGKRNGTLASVRADELAAQVLNGLVARHDLEPGEIEDVEMGCVTQIGEQGLNVGRIATQDERVGPTTRIGSVERPRLA